MVGPGVIHVFLLNGQSCQPGWPTVQTPSEPVLSGVKVKTLTHIACGRRCLVWKFFWAIEIFAPNLNNSNNGSSFPGPVRRAEPVGCVPERLHLFPREEGCRGMLSLSAFSTAE